MTKLQILNSFLTERFMAALDEIMEMVGGTLLEYEEETEHIRKENEFMRRRLLDLETITNSCTTCSVYLTAEDESTSSGQQECSSSLEPESVTPETHQNLRQHNSVKDEVLSAQGDVGPLGAKDDPTADSTRPSMLLNSVKTDADLRCHEVNEVIQSCDLPNQIKTEPFEAGNPLSDTDLGHNLMPQTADSESATTDTSSESHSLRSENVYRTSQSADRESSLPFRMNRPKHAFPDSVSSNNSYSLVQSTGFGSAAANSSFSTSHPAVGPASVNSTFPGGQSGPNGHFRASAHHPHPAAAARRGGGGEGVKGQGSYRCAQCGKCFTVRSRLKVHMLIHTGEKPFACGQCGKRFNNDGTLRNHQRVHMQLRLYSCPVCARAFKDAYTCRKHLRVHAKTGHADPGLWPTN